MVKVKSIMDAKCNPKSRARLVRFARIGGAGWRTSPIWVNTHTSVDSQTKSRVSDFGIAFRCDGDSEDADCDEL